MTILQIELNLLVDNGGVPGDVIASNQVTLNQSFFVEILVGDIRDNAQGVIGLDLNLIWDGLLLEAIEFDPTLAITPSFSLFQGGTLDNGTGRITGLAGASLPELEVGQAIGVNQLERFALLKFVAEDVSNGTANFTTRLTDYALADDVIADTIDLETFQPIEIIPLAPEFGQISGSVLEDIDSDGIGDSGLAGAIVELFSGAELVGSTSTDEFGFYVFSELSEGSYTVRQTNLPDYQDVSDSDAGDPNEISVFLEPGQFSEKNDFIDAFIFGPEFGEISGSVLEDIDGDGVGDQGLAGVIVELFLDSTLVQSTSTDATGFYFFSDLISGTYIVRQTNLSGYRDVSDSDGGDPNEITVFLAPDLFGGNNFIDELIPEPELGEISGNVLEDVDGDGIGDIGLTGVSLELLLNGTAIATTTTDTSGFYSFGELSEGSYTIRQTNLNGYQDVSDSDGGDPNQISVFIEAGQFSEANDFIDELIPALGQISGNVLEDVDGDGIGDIGLTGVVIQLFSGSLLIAETLTASPDNSIDESGFYLFSGLSEGSYTIRQTNLNGYQDVSDSDGGDPNQISVFIEAGQSSESNDFIDELIPEPEFQKFTFTFEYNNGDSYSGFGYAELGTYIAGQTFGGYTINTIESLVIDASQVGQITIETYTDTDTGYGITTNVSGSGSDGLGSESGFAEKEGGGTVNGFFDNANEADLAIGAIAIEDNSDAIDDGQIKFTTALSQFRTNYQDSDFVRPNAPDSSKYFDITNTGDGILRVSNIQVNTPGVNIDLNFVEGDLLLNPGATQRVSLTYAPSVNNESFDLSNALVIFSDAVNGSQQAIALAGKSTFNSDINYDGVVGIADLGALNHGKARQIQGFFDPTADVNGDGQISTLDVNIWLGESGYGI